MNITTIGIDLAKKKCVCATCKLCEFPFHRRSYGLMKPVVPSTVPYPDMRSR
jgi:hypothetical protein